MCKDYHTVVPPWVRNSICIVGCISVPAILVAAAFGAQITTALALLVGSYAMQTAKFAFEADSERSVGDVLAPAKRKLLSFVKRH